MVRFLLHVGNGASEHAYQGKLWNLHPCGFLKTMAFGWLKQNIDLIRGLNVKEMAFWGFFYCLFIFTCRGRDYFQNTHPLNVGSVHFHSSWSFWRQYKFAPISDRSFQVAILFCNLISALWNVLGQIIKAKVISTLLWVTQYLPIVPPFLDSSQ